MEKNLHIVAFLYRIDDSSYYKDYTDQQKGFSSAVRKIIITLF